MGAGELSIVAILAMLLIGPKQWPEIVSQVARVAARAQRIWRQAGEALHTALDEQEKQLQLEDNERRAQAADRAPDLEP